MERQNALTHPRECLYLCTRVSDPSGKPCADAFKVLIQNTEVRCYDDPKKVPANRGTDGDWYSKGMNHRVENGFIRRDLDQKEAWAVHVPDMQAFVDRYGACVVWREGNGFCMVEIYDKHRE